MEWAETGIVLHTRPHGETSTIAEIFTRGHGRHLGLVRGGRSRRMRPLLQTGNSVNAGWRARLADHLGVFSLEATTFRAASVIEDPLKLAGLTSLCSMAGLLPERLAVEHLYDAFVLVLDGLENNHIWPALAVRWELGLLETLGFGLDLSQCAGGGGRDNLIYVSPKSGQAVGAQAGEPYRDKLLGLPAFLLPGTESTPLPDNNDVLDGFALTGHFLRRHVFDPRGLAQPRSREHMIERLKRHNQPDGEK